MHCYSYIRFSSRKQRKGRSYERQYEKFLEYAELKRWKIATDAEYSDLAMTGTRGKNYRIGDLSRFLYAIEKKLVLVPSVLVVENLNRLTRTNPFDALSDLITKIIDAGVDIAVIQKDRIYTKKNVRELATLMELIIGLHEGHRYSSDLEDWSRWAWRKKREAVAKNKEIISHALPCWIERQIVKEDGKTKIVPVMEKGKPKIIKWKKDILLKIIDMYKKGNGHAIIARKLNADKVPTITGRTKKWAKISIQHFVNNIALKGEYQQHELIWEEITIDGKKAHKRIRKPIGQPVKLFPEIISKEEYAELQKVKKSNRSMHGRGSERVNLFQGIAYNKNVPMILAKAKKCGRYLQAIPEKLQHSFCFPYYPVEDAILKNIFDIKLEFQQEDKTHMLEARREELEDNIKTMTAKLKSKALPEYFEVMESYKAELDQLLSDITDKNSQSSISANVYQSRRLIKLLEADQSIELRKHLRQRIRDVVKRIDMAGEQVGTRNRKLIGIKITLKNGQTKSFFMAIKGGSKYLYQCSPELLAECGYKAEPADRKEQYKFWRFVAATL